MKCPTADVVLSAFVFLCVLCSGVRGEFFTSIFDLETLLHTEGEVAKTIDNYVQAEEQRLERIRRLGREYHKLYHAALGNPEAFLSNPVHAYLLLKHLTNDWKLARQLIEDTQSKNVVLRNISWQDLIFPEHVDLKGAATALMRLQEIYLLNTTKLASNEVEEFPGPESFQLSAGDCFEIGYQAFTAQNYYYCELWMQEALKRIEMEGMPSAIKISALEHMAYSNYMLGKADDAIRITKQILKEAPDREKSQRNLKNLEQYVRDVEAGLRPDIGKETRSKTFRFNKNAFFDHYEDYEKLCRGERLQSIKIQSNLHCRYNSRSSYLLLQPIKEEELCLDPRIVMYHDVISEHDVDSLKQLAIPKLKRAAIISTKTGESLVSNNRISKSAWLWDKDHPVVVRTTKMIQEITGLSLSTAEALHVINYGIGGHYEPHYDFSRAEDTDAFSSLGVGNRIATWIYYLSDVEAGGYTVFPHIGVQVKPKKGSAAFWLNLKRNGAGDLNTMHAACPVLNGSKWVANKWLHEAGNEFRRKCSLDSQE